MSSHPSFSGPDISIIIPAKNEEKRLAVFLPSLLRYCQGHPRSHEIIVVSDGSTDTTSETVRQFQKTCPLISLIELPVNMGKGYAVKTGILKAAGQIVLFLDADGSTAPDEIENNLHYFDEGCDIVIGSRVLSDGEDRVKAKFYRKVIGKIFNFFVWFFLFRKIHDTQCGFKMFRRDVAQTVFPRVIIKGFGFDIELLYLAFKMGFRVKEVPVAWEHRDGSKINLVKDSLVMFINILQIRNWHCTPINLKDRHIMPSEVKFMYEMEQYHWWFVSKMRLVQHLIKKIAREGLIILDAGCGTGLNLLSLNSFGRTFGFDITWQALAFCHENGLKNVVQCSTSKISFRPGAFDVITVFDLLEHLVDPQEAIREFNRLLKPDGRMVITVPAFKFLWSQHDEALCHFRRYKRKDIHDLVQGSGLKIERIGYFFFVSFFIVAPIRILRRLFVRPGEPHSDTTTLPPKVINEFLKWACRLEVRLADWNNLPVGTTLYAVLAKDSSAG